MGVLSILTWVFVAARRESQASQRFAEEAKPAPAQRRREAMPLRQEKPAKHLVVITTIFIEAIEKISDGLDPGRSRWYTGMAPVPPTRLPRPKRFPAKPLP